jgi:hypothetical protein
MRLFQNIHLKKVVLTTIQSLLAESENKVKFQNISSAFWFINIISKSKLSYFIHLIFTVPVVVTVGE